MLGALALGDIGQHFPPADPQWKGADSRAFLRHCAPARPSAAGASATPTSPWSASGRRSARMRGDARAARADLGVDAGRGQRQGHHHRDSWVSPAAAKASPRRPSCCWSTSHERATRGCRAPTAPPCCARASATHAGGFPRRGIARLRAHRRGRAPAADHREARHEHRLRRQAHRAWAGIARNGRSATPGMKDRHAVTRQRFTVHLPKRVAPDLAALRGRTSLRVLDAHLARPQAAARRAGRQPLRAGAARGARRARRASKRGCRRSPRDGVPNYFGEQRFGRDGDNVAQRAGDVRRPARAPRAALASAVGRALGAVQRACSPRASTRQLELGARGRGVDARRQPQRVRARAVQRRTGAAPGRVRHPSHRPAVGRAANCAAATCAREIELAALAGDDRRLARRPRSRRPETGAARAARAPATWLGTGATTARWSWRSRCPPGAYATVVLAELGDIRRGPARAGVRLTVRRKASGGTGSAARRGRISEVTLGIGPGARAWGRGDRAARTSEMPS